MSSSAFTFTPSSSTTTTTTGGSALNAKNYGCVGNGTVDDAPNLQIAINAAINTSTELYIPAGTYLLNSQVTISDSIRMYGDAEKTVFTVPNNFNSYMFKVTSLSQGTCITVRDLTFDGNSTNQTSGGGINATGSVESIYDRLHFKNISDWGMILGGFPSGAFGHHNRVNQCLFDGNGTNVGLGGGILCTSSDENFINRCVFSYLGGSGTTTPACIKDSAGLQSITDCTFVGSRGFNTAIRGVWMDAGNRTRIANCTFDGIGGDNIFVTGQQHQIVGCRFTSSGDQSTSFYSSIYLQYGATENTVVGCQFDAASGTTHGTRSYIRESIGNPGDNTIVGCVFNQTGYLSVGPLELHTNFGTVPATQVVACVPVALNSSPARITVSTTAPSLPVTGDLWVDTT